MHGYPSMEIHLCTDILAWICMHVFPCMDTQAWISMHGCPCADIHAWICIDGYLCMDLCAWISMHYRLAPALVLVLVLMLVLALWWLARLGKFCLGGRTSPAPGWSRRGRARPSKKLLKTFHNSLFRALEPLISSPERPEASKHILESA